MIPDEKKAIVKRASEIIRDYLYDEDESYAYIEMYFEKENGEKQAKRLVYGKPSKETPDLARDYPNGYIDDGEQFCPMQADEILFKSVTWRNFNGEVWNGLSLRQNREMKGGIKHDS